MIQARDDVRNATAVCINATGPERGNKLPDSELLASHYEFPQFVPFVAVGPPPPVTCAAYPCVMLNSPLRSTCRRLLGTATPRLCCSAVAYCPGHNIRYS